MDRKEFDPDCYASSSQIHDFYAFDNLCVNCGVHAPCEHCGGCTALQCECSYSACVNCLLHCDTCGNNFCKECCENEDDCPNCVFYDKRYCNSCGACNEQEIKKYGCKGCGEKGREEGV